MKEEREVAVRIFTERQGVEMPFMGFLGEVMNELSAFAEEPAEGEEEPEEPFPEEEPEDGDPSPAEEAPPSGEESAPEKSEFFAMGKLVETDDRLEIVYEEDAFTGMEDSVTSIGFAKNQPEIVTMTRYGLVKAALVFEKGKRHLSVYQTPFSEFELSVCALSVQNLLLREGIINLDYITELHGARTERCKMKIVIG